MKDLLHESPGNVALLRRHRDLRIVLPARALSTLGDQVTLVVLILWIGEHHAPLHVTALLTAYALPLFALAPIAGRLVDEYDSRLVLVGASLLQVGASIVIVLSGGFALTIAAVLVLQAGQAVSSPGWAALIPRIVGEENVGPVVGLSQSLGAAAGLAGAAVGGFLYAAVGLHTTLVIDTATFAVLVVAAAGVRTRRGRRADQPDSATSGVATMSGWRFVRRDELLRLLVPALCLLVLFAEATNVVKVFLLRESMDATAQTYGIAASAVMLGAIVGPTIAGRVRDDRRRITCAAVSTATVGALTVSVGLAPNALATVPLFLGIGVAVGAINAAIGAITMTRPPEHLRGRVLATLNGGLRGASVIAMTLGGVAGTVLGPRQSFMAAGLMTAAVAVLVLKSRRALDAATAVPDEEFEHVSGKR